MREVLEQINKLSADVRKLSEELHAHVTNPAKKQSVDVHHHFDPDVMCLLGEIARFLKDRVSPADVAALTAKLKANNDTLKGSVAENQPTSPAPV